MNSQEEKSREEKAKEIIHNATIASSTAAGATAQIAAFGADFLLATPIVLNMVIELGEIFGQTIDRTTAENLARRYGSTYFTKTIIGFFPIIGNVVNAAMTYSLVESLGWSVYKHLKENSAS